MPTTLLLTCPPLSPIFKPSYGSEISIDDVCHIDPQKQHWEFSRAKRFHCHASLCLFVLPTEVIHYNYTILTFQQKLRLELVGLTGTAYKNHEKRGWKETNVVFWWKLSEQKKQYHFILKTCCAIINRPWKADLFVECRVLIHTLASFFSNCSCGIY